MKGRTSPSSDIYKFLVTASIASLEAESKVLFFNCRFFVARDEVHEYQMSQSCCK